LHNFTFCASALVKLYPAGDENKYI